MLYGYMRISLDNEKQSLDLQYDALIKSGVDSQNIYQDKVSGAKIIREGLTKVIELLKEGDCLVVWKLDRLGRSISHLISLIEDFKKKGIKFKSLTEAIDTATAQGQLMYNLIGMFAEYERAIISERTKAGLEAAHKRGIKSGRPKVITSEQMQSIVEHVKNGVNKSAIARIYKIDRTTVIKNLKRYGL